MKAITTKTSTDVTRRGFLKKTATLAVGFAVAASSMGTLAAIAPDDAQAAAARRCYTISSANTPVYGNTGLTNRIGAIYGTDEVSVITVTGSYSKVNYPTARGSKTGYIRTGAILTATGGSTYSARAKVTTYKRPGGASYGYVSKGDSVVVLGTSGNYTQVKYPVSGGYKYAFVTTANANAYIKPTTPTPTPTPAPSNTRAAKLSTIANTWNGKYWTTNGRASNSSGSTSKYYYGIQCKGFASWVYAQVTGVTYIGSTQSNKYLLNYSSSNTTRINCTTSVTAASSKSAFLGSTAGDFVQMKRRSSGGPHSAIVMSANASGVTVLECNADGKCGVKVNTYSYSTWASKNSAFSIYRAR